MIKLDDYILYPIAKGSNSQISLLVFNENAQGSCSTDPDHLNSNKTNDCIQFSNNPQPNSHAKTYNQNSLYLNNKQIELTNTLDSFEQMNSISTKSHDNSSQDRKSNETFIKQCESTTNFKWEQQSKACLSCQNAMSGNTSCVSLNSNVQYQCPHLGNIHNSPTVPEKSSQNHANTISKPHNSNTDQSILNDFNNLRTTVQHHQLYNPFQIYQFTPELDFLSNVFNLNQSNQMNSLNQQIKYSYIYNENNNNIIKNNIEQNSQIPIESHNEFVLENNKENKINQSNVDNGVLIRKEDNSTIDKYNYNNKSTFIQNNEDAIFPLPDIKDTFGVISNVNNTDKSNNIGEDNFKGDHTTQQSEKQVDLSLQYENNMNLLSPVSQQMVPQYVIKQVFHKRVDCHESSCYSLWNEYMFQSKIDHPHILKPYQMQLVKHHENLSSPSIILSINEDNSSPTIERIEQSEKGGGCYIIYPHAETDLYDYCLHPYSKYTDILEIRIMLKQIATALSHIHDQYNITHQDIKPENIFKLQDNHFVLADFGLAKYVMQPSSTQDHSIISQRRNSSTHTEISPLQLFSTSSQNQKDEVSDSSEIENKYDEEDNEDTNDNHSRGISSKTSSSYDAPCGSCKNKQRNNHLTANNLRSTISSESYTSVSTNLSLEKPHDSCRICVHCQPQILPEIICCNQSIQFHESKEDCRNEYNLCDKFGYSFREGDYFAPEIIEWKANKQTKIESAQYPIDDKKADVFALGMSVFVCLFKMYPYDKVCSVDDPLYKLLIHNDKKVRDIFWHKFRVKIEYYANKFDDSRVHQLIPLLEETLHPNPLHRLSASQILAHPWLQ